MVYEFIVVVTVLFALASISNFLTAEQSKIKMYYVSSLADLVLCIWGSNILINWGV